MKVPYLKFIPLQKLVELGLNPTQVLLATIIISFGKDDKTLRAGLDNISEALGLSGSTIKRAIPKLVELKLVTVKSGYKQRNANEYLPTPKLKALYGQNDHINRVKMTTHTPKGYIKKKEEGTFSVPPSFSQRYKEYVEGYSQEYADKQLKRYLENVNK